MTFRLGLSNCQLIRQASFFLHLKLLSHSCFAIAFMLDLLHPILGVPSNQLVAMRPNPNFLGGREL